LLLAKPWCAARLAGVDGDSRHGRGCRRDRYPPCAKLSAFAVSSFIIGTWPDASRVFVYLVPGVAFSVDISFRLLFMSDHPGGLGSILGGFLGASSRFCRLR
jgi:hypothetical protein